MREIIRKSHNVSVLFYHIVCPAKCRRVVFLEEVDATLKDVCLEIGKRYDIWFIEIGADKDHVHFLVQTIPRYSPSKVARIIKSITAREIFRLHPSVKKILWGGEFWSDGYFVSTVGWHATEDYIRQYVKKQGTEKHYKKIHQEQLTMFE